MRDVDDIDKPKAAARFLILMLAVVFYALAIVGYLQNPPGFSLTVFILGAIGTTCLLTYLFASDDTCAAICHLATWNTWP